MERELNEALAPKAVSSESDLRQLLTARVHVAEAQTILDTINDLQARLDRIATARILAPPKAAFAPRSTTGTATEFSQIVERLLESWKYPHLGRVTYDTQKADIVIGGQDRANKGKGYRAIAFAAFAIGLMRYCRQREIPHPGFVVLDSPLNPFKGPTPDSGEALTDDVKVAFFETLAADNSGDQIIVIENEDAPEHVRSRVTYHRFSGNPHVDRYGLFPVS